MIAGETEVLGENLPQRHFVPPQIPHGQVRFRTPDRSGGKPATNRLSYGATSTCTVTDIHNWVEKFSQGRTKFADDARLGRPVEIATEATVQRVEELIRADWRITIDSVVTALGCSHGLAYSIMHDRLKLRKVCVW
jgi:hypothetical protein